MIIDTHAHLQFDQFKDEVPELLKRAYDANVRKIINVGCDVEKSKRAYEMLDEFDGVNGSGGDATATSGGVNGSGGDATATSGASGVSLYATLGLHPYDVLDLKDELLAQWKEWISKEKRIVAIGEIGLDYFKSDVPKYKQKDAFKKQLEFARDVKLPVIVHNREADIDTLEILREYPEVSAVFHCYGSSLEFAREIWKHGYLTSFTGIITYPNAKGLREVVKECAYDMFMVETDCPFLAPQSHRGQRNEPSFVPEVVAKIAEIKGWEVSEIEGWQMKNVKRFFGIS